MILAKTRYTKSFRIPIIELLREILNVRRDYSSVIKEMLAHTKEETTVIYLKQFENATLDKASELLNLK
ncbi:MAG: hypothetical protein D4R64_03835 [Porphyromonadaceae bacterium]|nr:MAG: hypothetical protein D4R64_03835 [Porphyromonadaceae bacterium]